MANIEVSSAYDLGIPGERRGEDRTKTTVYRPILFATRSIAGFCLLRNLSAGGMMGAVYTNLDPGEQVMIEFHPEYVAAGTVAWSFDEKVGVRFDQEIDVSHTLAVLGRTHSEGWIKRAPRLPLEIEAKAVIEDKPVPIVLQDISQRGIKAEIPGVRQGDEVSIRLEGLEPHKAIVRWVRGASSGLNFLRPFGLEELARWAISRQNIPAGK